MPVENVADRAAGFGIYTETAFGNDLFTVIAAARRGIEHARSGNGPALIEFKTFRRRGHGEHDDMAYVSKELREFWEARDPLTMYRSWLTGRAAIDEAVLTNLESNFVEQIDAAVEYAEKLPFPTPQTVTDRLFAPSVHDPQPKDRMNLLEAIETPAIPALTASNERKTGEHF
jgi:TPP-dependent pyruvate/acetoin dehydrogenase alpha subunit